MSENWKAVEVGNDWGIEGDVMYGATRGRGVIIAGLTKRNAHLVAAAPALLVALKQLIDHAPECEYQYCPIGECPTCGDHEIARAAIARAEGQ